MGNSGSKKEMDEKEIWDIALQFMEVTMDSFMIFMSHHFYIHTTVITDDIFIGFINEFCL